jgi:hypothetical protein
MRDARSNRMTTTHNGLSPPRRRPGPKPRGRTVVPLTITVTHAQRAGLEARADMEKSSISTVVRRFVAAGLAASGLCILAALIEIAATRCGAGALRAAKESAWTQTFSRVW